MKKVLSLFFVLQLFLFNAGFFVLADNLPEPPPQQEEEEEMEPEPEPIPEPELDEEDPEPEPEPEPEPIPEDEEEGEDEENIPTAKIILNEILADPLGIEAEDEFIELYNAGDAPLNLQGWRLDDENLDDNYSYKFLNNQLNYNLEPGAYLTLFRTETKLTLNNDGEAVFLFNAENQQVDSYVFDSSPAGRSWGRNFENIDEWMLFPTPSPDAENVFLNNPPVPVIDLQGGTAYMKINVTGENSFDPDGDLLSYLWEFEPGIFNETSNPLTYEYATDGLKKIKLKVTDSFGLSVETTVDFMAQKQFVEEQGGGGGNNNEDEEENEEEDNQVQNYPKLSLINEFMPDPTGADAGQEWIELYNDSASSIDLSGWYLDDEEGATASYKIPNGTTMASKTYHLFEVDLSLKNSADMVRLLDPNKLESQKINYSESKEALSYAKNSQNEFIWTSLPTPASANQFPAPPKSYHPGEVRFDSLLPNPDGTDTGNEKIVLKNMSSDPIDLLGWKISNGSSTKTLAQIILNPYSAKELSSTDFGLSLKNSDSSIYLYDPTENLIDEISWTTSHSGEWLFNPNSLVDGMKGDVKEVLDGDTLRLNFENKTVTVRLLGVDTPETVHPFKPVEFYGKQASDYLKNLLTGKQVSLNFDQNKIDKYGRVLAYIYLNDTFVNAEILKQGYGYAYTKFPFKFMTDFVSYEAQAKSSKKGLWADPEVVEEIEKSLQQELDEVEEEAEEATLISLSDEAVPSPESEKQEEEVSENPSSDPINPEHLECDSEFLKIDSFVPYPKKDSEEYIKLINKGSTEICLTGWQLDDIRDTGSKAFVIQEGVIAPGQVLEFGKEVTKLSLNNTNDCVSLISPSGDLADEICYKKTHEGEIFTHAGGNWTASTTKAKASTTAKKTATTTTTKTSFTRESSAYRSELINRTYLGNIVGIDEEEKMLVIQLEKDKTIPISYASSLFNINTVKELMDLTKPVELDVYETPDLKSLISLHSTAPMLEPGLGKKLLYPVLFLSLAGGAVLVLKRELIIKFLSKLKTHKIN